MRGLDTVTLVGANSSTIRTFALRGKASPYRSDSYGKDGVTGVAWFADFDDHGKRVMVEISERAFYELIAICSQYGVTGPYPWIDPRR